MKHKLFNLFITLLAIAGIFVIIGAVGKMDYMVSTYQPYPLINTVKTLLTGMLMCLPAIVREVL